jgi:hypothetical protein
MKQISLLTKTGRSENRWVNTSNSYSGKAGSGSMPININNSFGTIKLVHDMHLM